MPERADCDSAVRASPQELHLPDQHYRGRENRGKLVGWLGKQALIQFDIR